MRLSRKQFWEGVGEEGRSGLRSERLNGAIGAGLRPRRPRAIASSAVHREGTESGECPSDMCVRPVTLDPDGGGPTAV